MFVLFFLGTNVLLAQKKVSGVVKEADTNEPLIGARCSNVCSRESEGEPSLYPCTDQRAYHKQNVSDLNSE